MENKMRFINLLVVTLVLSFSPYTAHAHEDLTTKLTDAYANYNGKLLIKTDVSHGSPDGWLKVTNDNSVSNPAAKMMYATALIAVTTGKTCWVRIIPTEEGYWYADRIALKSW
ncbi:MAG: hypothetical protein D3909_12820 [Candidatus Electrothrix sp. ATG1]|nr:hypothetical protein [Candidatus Electrothrix sp. ATG1]